MSDLLTQQPSAQRAQGLTLVTGATSGLGRNAVEALHDAGVPVRATGRNAAVGAALAQRGIPFEQADLAQLDAPQAQRLLAGVDTVWHCAALSSPWGAAADFMAANVQATERLVSAAVAAGVHRVVHVSTPSLYFDFQHRLNVNEEQLAARPCNHYARTKAEAEAVIRRHAQPSGATRCATSFVILRPKALFGPHDRVLLPRLLRVLGQQRGRLPLPRGGAALLDFTYVANAVHALRLASLAEGLPPARAFNITNQAPMPLREVLTTLLHGHLGLPLVIRPLPYRLLDGAARGLELWGTLTGREPPLTRYSVGALQFDMTLCNTRAQQELGYTPLVGMAEGLRRTAAWYQKEGQIKEEQGGGHGPHQHL
jgi:nucleoside-diphosphate-sugar epimerase